MEICLIVSTLYIYIHHVHIYNVMKDKLIKLNYIGINFMMCCQDHLLKWFMMMLLRYKFFSIEQYIPSSFCSVLIFTFFVVL
jgi:hypothetical protein